MIENRPGTTAIAHTALLLGVLAVGFPVYLAFVASTQTSAEIVQNVPMSLLPGSHLVDTAAVKVFVNSAS